VESGPRHIFLKLSHHDFKETSKEEKSGNQDCHCQFCFFLLSFNKIFLESIGIGWEYFKISKPVYFDNGQNLGYTLSVMQNDLIA